MVGMVFKEKNAVKHINVISLKSIIKKIIKD